MWILLFEEIDFCEIQLWAEDNELVGLKGVKLVKEESVALCETELGESIHVEWSSDIEFTISLWRAPHLPCKIELVWILLLEETDLHEKTLWRPKDNALLGLKGGVEQVKQDGCVEFSEAELGEFILESNALEFIEFLVVEVSASNEFWCEQIAKECGLSEWW